MIIFAVKLNLILNFDPNCWFYQLMVVN